MLLYEDDIKIFSCILCISYLNSALTLQFLNKWLITCLTFALSWSLARDIEQFGREIHFGARMRHVRSNRQAVKFSTRRRWARMFSSAKVSKGWHSRAILWYPPLQRFEGCYKTKCFTWWRYYVRDFGGVLYHGRSIKDQSFCTGQAESYSLECCSKICRKSVYKWLESFFR